MNRNAKRIVGNISVGAFLAGVVAILAVNHVDPDFLTNDAELTAEANAGTPIVQGPIVPLELPSAKATTPAEVESARQIALEMGRSEATWDKNCVAWNPAESGGARQQWANRVAASWLESAGAGCPDAMTWPYYYVESFDSTGPGQLRITMEQAVASDPQIFTDAPETSNSSPRKSSTQRTRSSRTWRRSTWWSRATARRPRLVSLDA